MNFGKYGKVTWIKLMKRFQKYGEFQDLQVTDNICDKTFKDIGYFPFVHLIVNYVTLTFIQSLHGINFKYPDSKAYDC